MVRGNQSNVLVINDTCSQSFETYIEKRQAATSLSSPYIQLTARLSQVWLNQYTIWILLLVFRLSFAMVSLRQDLSSTESALSTACLESQAIASAVTSMPHYLAAGSNALVKQGIDSAIASFFGLLINLLIAVEGIISFILESVRSTYTCLLKMAIDGSLSAVIETTASIGELVNATMSAISNDLSSAVNDANSVLQGLSKVVQTLTAFTGESISIPELTVPDIKGLRGINIFSSAEAVLESLQTEIRTGLFENATDSIIALPFVDLKRNIANTLANTSFDVILLEPPPLVQLKVCQPSSIHKLIMSMDHDMQLLYLGIISALVVLALAIIGLDIWYQLWRWNVLIGTASVIHTSTDALHSVLVVLNPVQAKFSNFMQGLFVSPARKHLVQWLIAYILHTPATHVLLLMLVGMSSVVLQTLMQAKLKTLLSKQDVPSPDFLKIMNSSLTNSSMIWAQAANRQIASTEQVLNDKLFGWVENSTSTVNATLNEFTDEIMSTLNSTFHGTILYDAALQVVNCVLLLKIRGIENGLTWVHEQAHIELPLVSSSIYNISGNDQRSILQLGTNYTSSTLDSAMAMVIQSWQSTIDREMLISAVLFGIWSFVVLCGLIRITFYGHRYQLSMMSGDNLLGKVSGHSPTRID